MLTQDAAAPWSWSTNAKLCPANVETAVLLYRRAVDQDTNWVRPRFSTLRLQAWQDEAGTLPRSFSTDFVRLRYNVGRVSFSAELDVTAGAATATFPADGAEVRFVNGTNDAAWISAAIVRDVAADVARVARRTITSTMAPNGVSVPIVPGATQATIVILGAAFPATYSWQVQNTAGAVLSTFNASSAVPGSPGVSLELPGGAARLVCTLNPTGNFLPVQVVFRVPL